MVSQVTPDARSAAVRSTQQDENNKLPARGTPRTPPSAMEAAAIMVPVGASRKMAWTWQSDEGRKHAWPLTSYLLSCTKQNWQTGKESAQGQPPDRRGRVFLRTPRRERMH